MRNIALAFALMLIGLVSPPSAIAAAESQVVRIDIDAVKAALDRTAGPPVLEAVYVPDSTWNSGPTAGVGKIGGYYPERAERLGVSGAAVLQCAVGRSGALSHCTVLIASPDGFAFSDAALYMAAKGHLTVKPTADAHEGDLARVLVAFKNPNR